MTHDWSHIAAGPAGTVPLVRPDHPNILVYVRPCQLRRWGLVRSPFATRGEMRTWFAAWHTAP